MNASEKTAEIRRLCEMVDGAQMRDNDEVREFVKDLTKLVYDYKMPGKLYDFYLRDVEYHKQNKILFSRLEDVVKDIAAFCAAFPNLETEIENIIVENRI